MTIEDGTLDHKLFYFISGHKQFLGGERNSGLREKMIWHDFKTVIRLLYPIGSYYDINLDKKYKKANQEGSVLEKISALQPIIKEAQKILEGETAWPKKIEKTDKNIKVGKALIRIIPILFNSTDFLDNPTIQSYNKLQELQMSLQDIMLAAGASDDRLDDKTRNLMLSGPRAIIAFNLLKNAVKVQNDVTNGSDELAMLQVDVSDGRLTISNSSMNPFDAKLMDSPIFPILQTDHYGLQIAKIYSFLSETGVTFQSQEFDSLCKVQSTMTWNPNLSLRRSSA